MRREERDGVVGYRFESLDPEGVDAVVTTRLGGASPEPYRSLNLGLGVGDDPELVRANRRRALGAFGIDAGRSVWCRQVHSDRVVAVGEGDAGRGAMGGRGEAVPEADAMVTDVPRLPLCVTVADCVPVLVHDPRRGALGLAHAGWGGTVARIASKTVAAMVERFGSEAGDLTAAVGPSIGPRRYEVGPDVIERAREGFGGRADELLAPLEAPGRATFDLWAANRIDLESVGVPPARIEVAGISTDARLEEFYSHRAEGPTGRFAAAACLRPPS